MSQRQTQVRTGRHYNAVVGRGGGPGSTAEQLDPLRAFISWIRSQDGMFVGLGDFARHAYPFTRAYQVSDGLSHKLDRFLRESSGALKVADLRQQLLPDLEQLRNGGRR